MKKTLQTFLVLLFIASGQNGYAGDLLGGFISARQVNGLEYEITVTTYSYFPEATVDRCAIAIEIILNGGTPAVQRIPRINGPANTNSDPCNVPPVGPAQDGEILKPGIKKNVYQTNFTFTGNGTALVRYQNCCRGFEAVNTFDPLGIGGFRIETEFEVDENAANSTPVLQEDLLFPAQRNIAFTKAGTYVTDADGDVLTFERAEPLNTTQYKYPDDNSLGGGSYTVDAATGAITWNVPSRSGLFMASIKVTSSRGGNENGFSLMDFTIETDVSASIVGELAESWAVSPNPASDRLVITLDQQVGTQVSASLLDLTGREVAFLFQGEGNAGANRWEVALPAEVTSGLYVLKLETRKGAAIQKLFINR